MIGKSPAIAFCTTCKGRTQHLEQTLPKNLLDNQGYSHLKFIILDYGSQDHLQGYLLDRHAPLINSGRVVLYHYREPGPFRMAHAKNLAHRLGILEGADILVNLDADNYTGKDFSVYLAENLQPNSFMWVRMVPGQLPRGCSGRIAVTAEAFIKAGGYDEKYTEWSPDDKDFNIRLQRLGYEGLEIPHQYIDTVRHNDKIRFKEYPHALVTGVDESDFEVVNESESTITNYGHFGCGTVFKNFTNIPIEIGALPTRIFGIGLHKTGTNSLHQALKLLGLDSVHWPSAHWAKAVWLEMKALGRSHTLEKHYAAVDLPIPLLYQQLDEAYPGSKFILTTRPERQWLKSVQNHWSYEKNEFRATWNSDPFTHQVHKELYGQKGFNEEVFLQRFRRHHQEVKDYFKDRESDLLVMNGGGWPELCDFLDKPVPAVEYPKLYVTT